MNYKPIIVFDFEAGSKSKYVVGEHKLITQIAACVIHPRNLTIGETFNTEVRPLNMDLVEEEALKITGKTREGLLAAPHPDTAFRDFANFVNKYNTKKNDFFAPVAGGYHITGYDWHILTEYCKKYGFINENGEQKLFSNYVPYDLLHEVYWWNENFNKLENLQLVTLRKHMGLPTDKAHDALNDVLDTAKIMIKFIKLKRYIYPKVKFENSFLNNGID